MWEHLHISENIFPTLILYETTDVCFRVVNLNLLSGWMNWHPSNRGSVSAQRKIRKERQSLHYNCTVLFLLFNFRLSPCTRWELCSLLPLFACRRPLRLRRRRLPLLVVRPLCTPPMNALTSWWVSFHVWFGCFLGVCSQTEPFCPLFVDVYARKPISIVGTEWEPTRLSWSSSISFNLEVPYRHKCSLCFLSAISFQIKPDGVQRGIVGHIISRFETKGYKLVAMKTKQATKELLEQHYKDLVEKVRTLTYRRCTPCMPCRGRISIRFLSFYHFFITVSLQNQCNTINTTSAMTALLSQASWLHAFRPRREHGLGRPRGR